MGPTAKKSVSLSRQALELRKLSEHVCLLTPERCCDRYDYGVSMMAEQTAVAPIHSPGGRDWSVRISKSSQGCTEPLVLSSAHAVAIPSHSVKSMLGSDSDEAE